MGIERFLEAQENIYEQALAEIKSGRKQTHWMWFIFPQLKGIGQSHMAEYYGINGIAEAKEYLANPTLNSRLKEITIALLECEETNLTEILGTDNLKLNSSMTLFYIASGDELYKSVVDKFCGGVLCELTVGFIYR